MVSCVIVSYARSELIIPIFSFFNWIRDFFSHDRASTSFCSCDEKRAEVVLSFVFSTRFGIRNETPQLSCTYVENLSGGRVGVRERDGEREMRYEIVLLTFSTRCP